VSWKGTLMLAVIGLTVFSTAVSGAQAECLWLVVGASAASSAGIARKRLLGSERCRPRSAAKRWLFAQTIAASRARCSLGQSAWRSRANAQRLDRLRRTLGDAYVKQCVVRPNSLLAFRMSAVDPSIAKVPDDAVNWDEAARVSSTQAVSGGAAIVVVRHYNTGDAEDPLEGRRERVLLRTAAGHLLTLSEDCPAAGDFQTAPAYLAFECAREQAADEVLHEVLP
jgi:hypothetical protein